VCTALVDTQAQPRAADLKSETKSEWLQAQKSIAARLSDFLNIRARRLQPSPPQITRKLLDEGDVTALGSFLEDSCALELHEDLRLARLIQPDG
jgi:hypothetical protein